jgi:hypothetical protein
MTKLNAYMVALVFDGDSAPLVTNTITASSPEMASALLAHAFCVAEPAIAAAHRLNGVAVTLIQPGWLRAALRAVEGDAQPAAVVSLVPKGEQAREDDGEAARVLTGFDYANRRAADILAERPQQAPCPHGGLYADCPTCNAPLAG